MSMTTYAADPRHRENPPMRPFTRRDTFAALATAATTTFAPSATAQTAGNP